MIVGEGEERPPEELLDERLVVNLVRDQIRPSEEADAFTRLAVYLSADPNKPLSICALARRMKLDEDRIQKAFQLDRAAPEPRSAIDVKAWPKCTFQEIARLNSHDPQRELLTRVVKEGWSFDRAVDEVRKAIEWTGAIAGDD